MSGDPIIIIFPAAIALLVWLFQSTTAVVD